MSEIVFNTLSDEIQNHLHALANYQFVMIKHVLINGKSSKTDICKKLAAANNTNDHKSFRNCPVFKVLVNKKLMTRTKENNEFYYELTKINLLSNREIDDLIKIAQSSKLRYESK